MLYILGSAYNFLDQSVIIIGTQAIILSRNTRPCAPNEIHASKEQLSFSSTESKERFTIFRAKLLLG